MLAGYTESLVMGLKLHLLPGKGRQCNLSQEEVLGQGTYIMDLIYT